MACPVEWTKRMARHRYSQDDRMLSWKFQQEIKDRVEAFMDDQKQNLLTIGRYDIKKEPWRMHGIVAWRSKYGLKVIEKRSPDTPLVEFSLKKQKLSRQNTGR